MEASHDSNESLRDSLRSVPAAGHAGERDVAWLAGDALGASRNERGQLEIFMRGPRLDCFHPNVRSRVDHDAWLQTNGTRLEANRLVLPAEGHYNALAAFLLTHLVENGAKEDLVKGFRKLRGSDQRHPRDVAGPRGEVDRPQRRGPCPARAFAPDPRPRGERD